MPSQSLKANNTPSFRSFYRNIPSNGMFFHCFGEHILTSNCFFENQYHKPSDYAESNRFFISDIKKIA